MSPGCFKQRGSTFPSVGPRVYSTLNETLGAEGGAGNVSPYGGISSSTQVAHGFFGVVLSGLKGVEK